MRDNERRRGIQERIQVQDCIVLVIFYKSKEDITNKYSNSTSILFSLLYYVYQRTPKNEEDWISERELFSTLDIFKCTFGLGNW